MKTVISITSGGTIGGFFIVMVVWWWLWAEGCKISASMADRRRKKLKTPLAKAP